MANAIVSYPTRGQAPEIFAARLKATPIPDADAPLEIQIQRAFEMVANTAPFDATGHPAMSVPCAMSEGLPVGMMLIGAHYNESTIYSLAHALEQDSDWRKA